MSLEIKRLVVGQLQTNCYIVSSTSSDQAIIIDPGDDANYIIEVLRDLGKKPEKIIATHGHFDHILGAFEIKSAYKIPFLIHKNDEFLLDRAQQSAAHFLGIKADPSPSVDHYLQEGKEITIGNHTFLAIHTPGHTPGGVSLYSKKNNLVVVGDTIFANGGIGRTDFTYSKNNDLRQSVKNLMKLPENTIVYPGHGNITTIKEARKYFSKI